MNDMPDRSSVSLEVDNWESEWRKVPKENMPENLSQTLLTVNYTSYPNIYTTLKILAILPIISCTCERSASSVRLLKTLKKHCGPIHTIPESSHIGLLPISDRPSIQTIPGRSDMLSTTFAE